MGGIFRETQVNGDSYWTLFDSGSRNTYVSDEVANHLLRQKLSNPRSTALGGKVHQIKEACVLEGEIEGHSIDTHARVIDKIGQDENGRDIDILFGALSMQEWGIKLDLQQEILDFTHYTTDFVEF